MDDRFCSIQQEPLPRGNNARLAACYPNHQNRLAKQGAGASPSALDKDLSWMIGSALFSRNHCREATTLDSQLATRITRTALLNKVQGHLRLPLTKTYHG